VVLRQVVRLQAALLMDKQVLLVETVLALVRQVVLLEAQELAQVKEQVLAQERA
jgi:hypothetical protein